MVYENYVNLTFSEVIEGSQPLAEPILISLIILCFGIAFGAQWGFNKIYNENRIKKFKDFRAELISNLKFKLKKLALTTYRNDDELNKEIKRFIEEWQDFQENIKDYYDKLLWWRKEVLVIFSLAGICYFIRLIRPDLLFVGYKISLISNSLFLIGLISIFVFGYKIINLDTQIAKYTMEKTSAEEIFKNIISRVFNRKRK